MPAARAATLKPWRSATSSRLGRRPCRPRCSPPGPSRSSTTAVPTSARSTQRTLDRLKDVFRTRSDVLLFTASGTGAMESAVANLCAPGDRVAVVVHGSFGERWLAICEQHELDVQAIRYEWGERPDPDEVGAAVRESGVGLVLLPAVRHLDRGRLRRPRDQGGGRRRTPGRRRDLVPRRCAARNRRMGDRRRRLGLPEGADGAARPRDGVGARGRALRGKALAQLLLRLEAQQEGAGRARRGLHARGLAHPQPRRRARPPARARARGGVRPSYPSRAGDPRRRQGDGPRALLARRRLGCRRDGDPLAGRHRCRRRCSGICAIATA